MARESERPGTEPISTLPPKNMGPAAVEAVGEFLSAPDPPAPEPTPPVTRGELAALAGRLEAVSAKLDREAHILRLGMQDTGTSVHTKLHEIDVQMHQIKHAVRGLEHHRGLVQDHHDVNDKTLATELEKLRVEKSKDRYAAAILAASVVVVELFRMVMTR